MPGGRKEDPRTPGLPAGFLLIKIGIDADTSAVSGGPRSPGIVLVTVSFEKTPAVPGIAGNGWCF